MSIKDFKPLILGISARALFDMRAESEIFITKGEAAYRAHQKKNLDTPLRPGTVFPLVKKLLALNEPDKQPRVEIVLFTKNDAETGHRIYESMRHHGLYIPRAVMSKGEFDPEVLKSFEVDLFLSRNHDNVADALKAGIPAAQVYDPPVNFNNNKAGVHFAFDGDKVLFAGLSENINTTHGLSVYLHHERANIEKPMAPGPFASLLTKLNALKKSYGDAPAPIKISLVTMRSEIRPLNTLKAWDQYVDTVYLLGRQEISGSKLKKAPLLKAIGADIFFDDSKHHTEPASEILPTGYVPDVYPVEVPSLSEIMNMAASKKISAKKISSPKKTPRP